MSDIDYSGAATLRQLSEELAPVGTRIVLTERGKVVGVTGAHLDPHSEDVVWLSWTYVDAAAEIDGALEDAGENPDLLYAGAQVHAMAGRDARFFEFVRRALGAGYPPDYFRFEPCFRPYRDDPAFLDLLTRPAED